MCLLFAFSGQLIGDLLTLFSFGVFKGRCWSQLHKSDYKYRSADPGGLSSQFWSKIRSRNRAVTWYTLPPDGQGSIWGSGPGWVFGVRAFIWNEKQQHEVLIWSSFSFIFTVIRYLTSWWQGKFWYMRTGHLTAAPTDNEILQPNNKQEHKYHCIQSIDSVICKY